MQLQKLIHASQVFSNRVALLRYMFNRDDISDDRGKQKELVASAIAKDPSNPDLQALELVFKIGDAKRETYYAMDIPLVSRAIANGISPDLLYEAPGGTGEAKNTYGRKQLQGLIRVAVEAVNQRIPLEDIRGITRMEDFTKFCLAKERVPLRQNLAQLFVDKLRGVHKTDNELSKAYSGSGGFEDLLGDIGILEDLKEPPEFYPAELSLKFAKMQFPQRLTSLKPNKIKDDVPLVTAGIKEIPAFANLRASHIQTIQVRDYVTVDGSKKTALEVRVKLQKGHNSECPTNSEKWLVQRVGGNPKTLTIPIDLIKLPEE